MKNIHVLPTDKPSRLHFDSELFISPKYQLSNSINSIVQGKSIYITSDEEIKEENLTKEIYVIDTQTNNIGKLTCKNRFFKGSSKLIEVEWKNKQNIWNYYHIREIILTTDVDLIADGVQAIDDEFLEWFVKNPTCEEVEINKIYNDYGETDIFDLVCTSHSFKYKIIIPKEERERGITITHIGKQETLEEFANKVYPFYRDVELREAIELGANWQQEQDKNKYSEEEVIELTNWYLESFLDDSIGLNGKEAEKRVNHLRSKGLTKEVIDYWFEQFKKK